VWLLPAFWVLFTYTRPDGVMVRASDLRLNRSWVRLPAIPHSYNNFGQVVHTRVPLSTNSKFGTSQRAVMPCGWKGNCRSGVTPAMHHRLLWFIRLRVLSLRKKDEQLSALPTCLCQLHSCQYRDEWSSRLHVWHTSRLCQQHRRWLNTRCSTHTYHSRWQKFFCLRTACVEQFTGYYKTDHQLQTV